MAKKTKGEIVAEEVTEYLYVNFPRFLQDEKFTEEYYKTACSILEKHRSLKGLKNNVGNIAVFTYLNRKDDDFYKKYPFSEIIKIYNKYLSRFNLTLKIKTFEQIEQEFYDILKEKYYKINEDIRKFDDSLKFGIIYEKITDLDIQNLAKSKLKEVEENFYKFEKSIFIYENLRKIINNKEW